MGDSFVSRCCFCFSSFFRTVSLFGLGPFLRPGHAFHNAPHGEAVKTGRLPATAKRLGLDGLEYGAMLGARRAS
jgi:hypothetical protein